MDAFPSIHVRLRFRLHVKIYECLWHVKKHKCKVRDELKMQQSNSQQIQIAFFRSLAAAANTALELHTITTTKNAGKMHMLYVEVTARLLCFVAG